MAVPQPSPISKAVGQSFSYGRFAIVGQLGHGGMGEVYRAEDTKLKRPVALKRLSSEVRSDPVYREKLLEEAERASALNCPNIASLYDVVEDGDEVCLVMEFVEGTNLRQGLTAPMPMLTFLEVALQCTDALIAAHDRGIVHRDIKPENIMLTPSGHVKVLDFGLARRLPHAGRFDVESDESTMTTVELIAGTVGYMSPETLLSRPIDARTDLFSLGVVFYEALTGRHPFRDSTFMATADRVLHAEPPKVSTLNPQVPPALDLVIDRMIAKNAEHRYANAHEVHTALLRVQQQVSTGEWKPPVRTRRRKRVLASAAGALLLIIALWANPSLFNRWSEARATVLPQQMRVAVLPFRTIGGDSESQAYSNGLTETLTTRLMRLTTSEPHRGRPLDVVSALEVHSRGIHDVEHARKELGANLVLEGSVQHAGQDVRVNFALLDARTHKQLRAQTLTSTMQAGFSFEDQVADTVARMLEVELHPSDRHIGEAKQSAEARESYLRGRGYLQDFDKPQQLKRAIAAFNEAISADANFPAAYAGLGTAYWHQYSTSRDVSAVEKSREACGQAMALDKTLAEAHECLARIHEGTGEYESAIAELQSALEKNPTSDSALRLLASTYQAQGRYDDAEQTFVRALNVRPQYWAGYNQLGGLYYGQARYDDAARMFSKVVELAPDSFRGYFNLAGVKIEQRKYQEAINLLENSIAIEPSAEAYANLGTAKFYQGDYQAAAQDYDKAISLGGENYELWGNLAESYYWSKDRKSEAASAYAHAIRLASEAVRVNPRDGTLRAELAKYFAMSGQQDKAAAELAHALRLAPKQPRVYFVAALVEQRAGKRERALWWLEKAVKAGYSPASVQDDPVFATLHTNPEFQKLVSSR